MRYIIQFLLIAMLPEMSAYANTLQCPGTEWIQPTVLEYIKNIMPEPFTQCYYTAEPVNPKLGDVCDQLYKNINTGLLNNHQIQVKNWGCHYLQENKNYTFTFSAIYMPVSSLGFASRAQLR